MSFPPHFFLFWGYYYRLMDFYRFNVLSNIQQSYHLNLFNAQNCNSFGQWNTLKADLGPFNMASLWHWLGKIFIKRTKKSHP